MQGHAIVRAEAEDESGTLVIALDDGTELCVPADTDFEAWSVMGVDGAAVVALPGSGIGRWDSMASTRRSRERRCARPRPSFGMK